MATIDSNKINTVVITNNGKKVETFESMESAAFNLLYSAHRNFDSAESFKDFLEKFKSRIDKEIIADFF